jgi:deoxyribodipyrimidine photolyase-related protein
MLGIVFPHQCFKQVPEHWTQIWFVRHDIGYGGKQTTVPDFHIQRKIFLRAVEAAWLDGLPARFKRSGAVRIVPRGAPASAWATREPCEVWDPVDRMLEAQIRRQCPNAVMLESPAFLLTREEALNTLGDGKHASHHAFYQQMRERTRILMSARGEPLGGALRLDEENRQALPKGATLPDWAAEIKQRQSKWVAAAAEEVLAEQGRRPIIGEWTGDLVFPTTRSGALAALRRFVGERLAKFGPYQDAMLGLEDTEGAKHDAGAFLFHSVLSAPLNVGLLTPSEVITAALEHRPRAPLPSLEGFIAQVLGWREFMRAVYVRDPVAPPNRLGHRRSLSPAWFGGAAGVGLKPLDDTVARVSRHAYLHHIDRLMIVGNAMFLMKIKPDEVYRWFMTMFADSWDWVMIGNVYYMSQWCSDAITTKPYISSSAYVRRMSRGWEEDDVWGPAWDALYWSTVDRLGPLLRRNYRMAAQVAVWERKSAAEKAAIKAEAKKW